MVSKKASGTSWSVRVVMGAMVALMATASLAQAQTPSEHAPMFWAASSIGQEATSGGEGWGRLILKDGALTFRSTNYEWNLPVESIKRLDVARSGRALEVESFSGQTYQVAILDATMVTGSPRRAVDAIQRVVSEAPSTRLATLAARSQR